MRESIKRTQQTCNQCATILGLDEEWEQWQHDAITEQVYKYGDEDEDEVQGIGGRIRVLENWRLEIILSEHWNKKILDMILYP